MNFVDKLEITNEGVWLNLPNGKLGLVQMEDGQTYVEVTSVNGLNRPDKPDVMVKLTDSGKIEVEIPTGSA